MPPDVVATAGSAATSSTSAATTISSTAPAPADTGPSGSPIGWRSLYPVHPCADVFPMMSDEEIDALAADIKDNGLRAPMILWLNPADQRLCVLDGRNRLEALARNGILPGDSAATNCMVERKDIHDPVAFVISANIRRRHLTKAQQAELIVKTTEAGAVLPAATDRATLARSANGQLHGSTKDPVLAQAVAEAAKHGISKRTVQNARAKVQGKTIGVSRTMPRSAARPLAEPPREVQEVLDILQALQRALRLLAKLDGTAARLTVAEQRTVRDRLLTTRAAIDAAVTRFGDPPTGDHEPEDF